MIAGRTHLGIRATSARRHGVSFDDQRKTLDALARVEAR